jgi:hypothetical protein
MCLLEWYRAPGYTLVPLHRCTALQPERDDIHQRYVFDGSPLPPSASEM